MGGALATCLALAALCTGASAFTVQLGATSFPDTGEARGCFSFEVGESCSLTWALINVPLGITAQAPGDGTIVSWRVRAHVERAGSVRLVVLSPEADGSYTSTAISEPAADVTGNPNPTHLKVKAGSFIGATTTSEGPNGSADIFGLKTAAYATLFSGFGQIEETHSAASSEGFGATEIGASLLLAPQPTSLSPTSGPASGGTPVTILGKYLAGTTQVLFGSAPAGNVVEGEQTGELHATAPAGTPGSTVDVRIVGPGGTSAPSPAMRFTYPLPPPPPAQAMPPSIAVLTESNSTFLAGRTSTSLTGTTAARHQRGTIFSFTLDRPATVTAEILRRQTGRRVGAKCQPFRSRLAHRPRCTRLTPVATLTRVSHADVNKLPFTGRVAGRDLAPGLYRIQFTASNSAGASAPRTLAFTVVAR